MKAPDAMAARWREITSVVDAALDLAPGAQRAALVEARCASDPTLRVEVERWLRGAESAGEGFLDQDAATDAAPLLAWIARQALPAGTRFGAYELLNTLGRGGMATVYLAQDHKHHRRVAVKVLHAEIAAAVGRESFLREIDIAAGLHHPHILPLHDSGVSDDLLYYVMPYVEGESLRERLRREGTLAVASALSVLREVAGALDYAHRQGVVHRDIKPENILLQDGQAIVADFGIARAIGAGAIDTPNSIPAIGTPAYMSPEQAARRGQPDGRTDIYALGCVVYEMLAGTPPFSGPVEAVLKQHESDPVPSLRSARQGIPVHIEEAVARALRKSPGERFSTAAEFVAAVDEPGEATTRPARKRRWLRMGIAAAVTAIAILIGGAAYLLRPARHAPPPDPGLVAILPFRIVGAGPELGWLSEGLVDLLSVKLGGEGGLRAVATASVLSAWRGAGHASDRGPDAMLRLARSLGAGHMLEGSVVGSARRVTLSASLVPVQGSADRTHVTVEGPVDSLSALVDLLAGRILGMSAGTEAGRLASLTTTSMPAIRAYLAGRGAFREGRLHDAFDRFNDAMDLDSTFALAALELVHTSIWTGPVSETVERGRRLALAGRHELGRADQTLLDLWTRPLSNLPEYFRAWSAAASAYPDRAEIWYQLGDAYYHHGGRAGLTDPLGLAAEAFRRGWRVDSVSGGQLRDAGRSEVLAEPIGHLVEMAQQDGDANAVRRLVAVGLASDSASPRGYYLRWHAALSAGGSALRDFWADSLRLPTLTLAHIYRFSASSGVGMDDHVRSGELMFAQWEAAEPEVATFHHSVMLHNGGRPRAAEQLLGSLLDAPDVSIGLPIREALYWSGSMTAAQEAARRLPRIIASGADSGLALQRKVQSLCALATWRAALGDYAYADRAIRQLVGTAVVGLPPDDSLAVSNYRTLCVALLGATRSSALNLPDAPAALDRADRAALTFNVGESMGANLVVARVAEEQGDLPRALRAVRRRASGYTLLPHWYLSTFLREEGRLAALTGDTAGAVRAYGHFLALRPDPEPELRPEVERVRAALAALRAPGPD
jgi:TolB-like protein/tetratricopeptide (TPR) repeat protein